MTSRHKAILWTVVIVSAIPRFLFPNQPLLERHGFRQTQTAMSVRAMLEGGIKWADYETPIFGPPWRVPMEFPTYQVSAAVLIRATGLPIDPGCRLTHLAYFYVSAWLLFLIARRCLADPVAVLCVMAIYLLSPHTILWSRACMIEFTAVTFGLLYVYGVIRWLDRPTRIWWAAIAVAGGALVAVTKVTTFAAFAPMVAVFGVASIWRQPWGVIGRRLPVLALVAIVPLIAGAWWVRYADAVKAASPFTAWLTSAALHDWNYGTLDQRMQLKEWYLAFETSWREVLPYGIAILPFIALRALRNLPRDARLLLLGAVAGWLLPIVVFFNLYLVHDYYEAALTPCLAILAGYGLAVAIRWIGESRRRLVGVATVGLASYLAGMPYLYSAYTYEDSFVRVGRLIEQNTPPGECIMFTSHSWSSAPLYYANRRGCLITWVDGVDWRRLPLEKFTTLGTTTRGHRITGWYAHVELVGTEDGAFIYRMKDPLPYPSTGQTPAVTGEKTY